jgi:hypothetical protein
MSDRLTCYYVLTTDKRQFHGDHGSWTRHLSLETAMETAEQTDGDVYRRTVTLNGDKRTETLRLVQS